MPPNSRAPTRWPNATACNTARHRVRFEGQRAGGAEHQDTQRCSNGGQHAAQLQLASKPQARCAEKHRQRHRPCIIASLRQNVRSTNQRNMLSQFPHLVVLQLVQPGSVFGHQPMLLRSLPNQRQIPQAGLRSTALRRHRVGARCGAGTRCLTSAKHGRWKGRAAAATCTPPVVQPAQAAATQPQPAATPAAQQHIGFTAVAAAASGPLTSQQCTRIAHLQPRLDLRRHRERHYRQLPAVVCRGSRLHNLVAMVLVIFSAGALCFQHVAPLRGGDAVHHTCGGGSGGRAGSQVWEGRVANRSMLRHCEGVMRCTTPARREGGRAGSHASQSTPCH